MKNSQQVEAEFRADLKALLKKYSADIEPIQTEYRREQGIYVYIPSVWDGNEIVSELAEFNIRGISIGANDL
jgi:hypothetical protein